MVIIVNLFECVGFTFEADCETITSPDGINDLVAGICCCARRSDTSSSEPFVCRKVLEKLDYRVEEVNDGLLFAFDTGAAQCAVDKCVCY